MVYHAGGFDVSQLKDPKARKVIQETLRVINQAVDTAVPHEVPAELRYALENNGFIFSGFKTFHALREVGLSMVTDKGEVKPYADFQKDVQQINAKYNVNYLRAEYAHALGSSLMAAKWADLAEDDGDYYLQYRTAMDNRVREDHRLLEGTTLPASDPFWDKYYPPNGWGCRCDVDRVLRDDYAMSDPKLAMLRGDNATEAAKQQMFRFNPGKEMKLFPPKHPYYKAPAQAAKVVKQVSEEEAKAKRLEDMIKELPDTLTDEEKKAIAEHNFELERALGITKGERMSVDKADKQNANPNHVPKYIIDPNGPYCDKHAHYRLNPDYDKDRDYPNGVNCQTCAPAYALRLKGFDVSAKPCTKGSKLEYLSLGRAFEVWKNIDGTPAEHVSMNDWLAKNNYKTMTAKRYLKFFKETCKEVGVYELSIGWRSGGGHATILQKFPDGTLKYIEPQHDNSKGSGYEWKDLDYLAESGAARVHDCRGIMRIDNKLFNLDFIEIFNK